MPRPTEPTGHFVPKGDPQVRQLSRTAAEHAEVYVRDTVDPILGDLRREVAGTLGGGRVTEQALEDVKRLQDLVRALPGTVAEQVARARSLDELSDTVVDDPTLYRAINQLQSTYPWMAPRLVRLRHAVSRQAIDQNVLGPAGEQMGL